MPRLEALTTGQLLDRIFTLYRKHFVLFFTIAVIPQLSRIILVLTESFTGVRAGGSVWTTVAVLFFVWLPTMFALVAVGQGATTVAVSDLYLEQPTSVKSSYARVARMSLRLIGMLIGYSLLVSIGFFFLIAPGIYFGLTYALATAVMAVENVSFSEAMTRSKDLVKGNRGRIFIIFVLHFVMWWAIAVAIGFPYGIFVSRTHLAVHYPILAQIFGQLVETLASALSMPVSLIGFTLAYYDARVRKEAFDLEYMMETEAATLPPAPVEPLAATATAGAASASASLSGSAGDVIAASTGGSTFMLFDQQPEHVETATTSAGSATDAPTEG